MREIKFRAWSTVSNRMMDWLELKKLFVNTWLDVEVVKVMQYTGLRDKNGKEIYEGDILKFKDEIIEPIKAKPTGFIGLDMFSELSDPGLKNTEVIGNVYENKDLLK